MSDNKLEGQRDKYTELANLLMGKFEDAGLTTNIVVGSTDTIDWNDFVSEKYVVTGVLGMAGGNNTKLSGSVIKNENFTLALALPNNTTNDFASTLAVIRDVITAMVNAPVSIKNIDYTLVDNGTTSTQFGIRIKGGNELGVVYENFMLVVAPNLLESAGATITFNYYEDDEPVEAEMVGDYHYSFVKQKLYDSEFTNTVELQKNLYKGKSLSLVIEYYKIKSNSLHQALETEDSFVVTIDDGNNVVLDEQEMEITSYTEDVVRGGYVNCKVTLTSKG